MSILLTLGGWLLLGAVAGVLAGLFGIGGGLIIVPVLVFSFDLHQVPAAIATHLAVGTSLASIAFTSISSVRAHHERGAVRWGIFRPMAAGLVLGAALGAVTAAALAGVWLRLLIGVFAIAVGVQMALALRPAPGREVPGPAGLAAAGGIIGWVSALFGIGGGSLSVPWLSYCNVRMQQAVATSAACGLPIAVAGAVGYVWMGLGASGLPEGSVGYIYGPALLGIVVASVPAARLGARLAHRWPADRLKRAFSLLLFLVGTRFLWQALPALVHGA